MPFGPKDRSPLPISRAPAADPTLLPVQLNVKIPWHYREQLTKLAAERGISLTRLISNALVRAYPPERT